MVWTDWDYGSREHSSFVTLADRDYGSRENSSFVTSADRDYKSWEHSSHVICDMVSYTNLTWCNPNYYAKEN